MRNWLAYAPFVLAALPCHAQFGGPAGFGGAGGFGDIQSAGAGQPANVNRIRLSPWLAVNGIFGHEDPYTTSRQPSQANEYWGASALAGLNGGKAWARTSLAGTVMGTYNYMDGSSPYKGGTAWGVLGLSHMFNQKVGISISEMGGSTFGGLAYGGGFAGYGNYGSGALQSFNLYQNGNSAFGDPNQSGVVNQEVFGNRINYTGTSAAIHYQPDRRWMVGGGISYYLTNREGSMLSDTRAVSGSAMVNYRLSRRSYFGGAYVYSSFFYPRIFGSTSAQQAYAQYTLAINERSRVLVWGGGVFFRGDGIGAVTLDPALADLLGQPVQLVVQNFRGSSGIGGLNYSYAWRWASFSAGYTRSVSPGNGLFYMSMYDSVFAGLSRPLGDHMSVGVSGAWARTKDLVVTKGHSEMRSAAAYWGWSLGKGFHLTASGTYRTSVILNGRVRGSYAMMGVAWSPGDRPLHY